MVEDPRARPRAQLVRLLPRHQQHHRRAVRHLRRVAGGDETVLLERGLQRREPLERGLRSDSLVVGVDVAVETERQDLAIEAALVACARGALLRAQCDLVALLARDPPLLRDQLGAEALVDDGMALAQLRRKR